MLFFKTKKQFLLLLKPISVLIFQVPQCFSAFINANLFFAAAKVKM
jgi:hypothetical protein